MVGRWAKTIRAQSLQGTGRPARQGARRDRNAPRRPAGTESATPQNALGQGLRIGVELVVAVVVRFGIGWAIDHWFGTKPLFMAVFFFLGIGAGMWNVYRAVKGMGSAMGYRGGERRRTRRGTTRTRIDVAIELHPLDQFNIEPIVPLHIGGVDASFTNSALFMTVGGGADLGAGDPGHAQGASWCRAAGSRSARWPTNSSPT